MPPEMAKETGLAEGSIVVLHAKDGGIEAEVIPPLSPEVKQRVHKIYDEFKEALEEMKRLGD